MLFWSLTKNCSRKPHAFPTNRRVRDTSSEEVPDTKRRLRCVSHTEVERDGDGGGRLRRDNEKTKTRITTTNRRQRETLSTARDGRTKNESCLFLYARRSSINFFFSPVISATSRRQPIMRRDGGQRRRSVEE